MATALLTDTDIVFALPGDIFRSVNPRTFSRPPLRVAEEFYPWGTGVRVTCNIEGIPDPVDVLFTLDADLDDVYDVVQAFNANPAAGWARLLEEFFTDQRARNAQRRAELKADAEFLIDLEASLRG